MNARVLRIRDGPRMCTALFLRSPAAIRDRVSAPSLSANTPKLRAATCGMRPLVDCGFRCLQFGSRLMREKNFMPRADYDSTAKCATQDSQLASQLASQYHGASDPESFHVADRTQRRLAVRPGASGPPQP